MDMYIDDTIAGIATAPGVGGVGIIRVSGKDSFSIVNSIFESKQQIPLMERKNRSIQYGYIVDEEVRIDEVLLLLMKGPHSYTAEDIVEIQCHGGVVPIRKIIELLMKKNVRLAEAGEFTKRAFLNGRIDLTQAEAIIDIIEAKSEKSLTVAMNQLEGRVSHEIRKLRNQLIELIARLEVTIDYPEEDIEELTGKEVYDALHPICEEMDAMLKSSHSGRLIRDGIMTVIVGLPNAGKSSLMNALLKENRAIVTDIPGTTRDSIEEYMNCQGTTLRIVDTAGIRDTEDVVEKIGVERSLVHLEGADLSICVIDSSKPLLLEEKELLKKVSGKPSIVYLNKSDLGAVITANDIEKEGQFTRIAYISAASGEGLKVLSEVVEELVSLGNVTVMHGATLSNVRHIHLMEMAKEQIDKGREGIIHHVPIEFVATDIREAWEILGEITGDSVRDDMTSELFSRFCLGK